MTTLGGLECPAIPRWSFVEESSWARQQLYRVILVVLFIVYVVFEDPNAAKKQRAAQSQSRTQRSRSSRPSIASKEDATPALLVALGYDLPTHPPESLDWLNVLLAQTISAYRSLITSSTSGSNGGAIGFMETVLNRKTDAENSGQAGLVTIDRILVGEVELGDKFPIISNARVRPSGSGEEVRIELDVDYADLVSLSITTSLLVNFPRPRFAVLPIALSISLERFSATLSLSLPSPLSLPSSLSSPHVHLSLHPDFTLQLNTTSLLGSKAKLQDIPKIEQLILGRIRGAIEERIVLPSAVSIGLPGLLGSALIPRTMSVPTAIDSRESNEGEHSEEWEWTGGVSPNADSDIGQGGVEEGMELSSARRSGKRASPGASTQPTIPFSLPIPSTRGHLPSPTTASNDSIPGQLLGRNNSNTSKGLGAGELRYRNPTFGGVGAGVRNNNHAPNIGNTFR